MTEWRFIDSGPCAASYNMAVDEAIAISVRNGSSPPTLRVYGWDRPSVSLGSFQKISDIDVGFCAKTNVPIVRRPTGGRAILHDDELTYSFSSRSEGAFSGGLLDSYRQLSAAFKSAIETLGLHLAVKTERESGRNLARSPLCFKSTSYGEITFKGKKLIGSAQKRWRDGFLQQGSIPYTVDGDRAKRVFALESPVDLESSVVGLKEHLDNLEPEKIKKAIAHAFEGAFQTRFSLSSLSPEEILLARELQTLKYLSQDWTYQRQGLTRLQPHLPL
ncbi:MAG TPA: biotin/lipoate A/B protein ligase family protein [Thermodesulfovibrionales bacterium]|nr:biotin/lipoate A/B protein ligase family protein [Thermodesulfovibrionales bacterium]